jgi:hypothetical protein
MSLDDAIKECDKLREELEGVGLSDGLKTCVELAYELGIKALSEPFWHMYVDDTVVLRQENGARIKLKVIERSGLME